MLPAIAAPDGHIERWQWNMLLAEAMPQ